MNIRKVKEMDRRRGDTTQRTAKLCGATITHTWDFFDRLIKVETATKRVSYKYDPTGRRIERTTEDLVNSTTKVNRWAYLNLDQWAEMDELYQGHCSYREWRFE